MYGIDRVVLIVLDSVGVGALPDAARFGDDGSDTLGNTARAVGGLRLPHFRELGLGNIHPVPGVAPVARPCGAYGRMAESSAAKDTTIGHWELAGVVSPVAFPTFPRGFPAELISDYEQRIGRRTLGNYPASGTVILEELGAEHMRTGYPIVYTSSDSVFQVAALLTVLAYLRKRQQGRRIVRQWHEEDNEENGRPVLHTWDQAERESQYPWEQDDDEDP